MCKESVKFPSNVSEEPAMRNHEFAERISGMLEEELLAEYMKGQLPEDQQQAVENHLAGCDRCLEELLLLREAQSDDVLAPYDAVSPALTRAAIKQIPASRGRLPASWQTAFLDFRQRLTRYAAGFFVRWSRDFTPVRGCPLIVDPDFWATEKFFPGIGVRIEILRTGTDRADIRVTAQAFSAHAVFLRVTLCRANREISSFLLADAPVLFEAMPFDHYKLLFSVNGQIRGGYSFTIKEGRNDG